MNVTPGQTATVPASTGWEVILDVCGQVGTIGPTGSNYYIGPPGAATFSGTDPSKVLSPSKSIVINVSPSVHPGVVIVASWTSFANGCFSAHGGITMPVVAGSGTTPGGPSLEEIQKRLEDACNEQHAGLQEISRLNNETRELIPKVKLATEVVKWDGKVADAGSKLWVGHPLLSSAYKWASYGAKATELYGKYTAYQMEQQVKHWDRVVVEGVKAYESTCKGITYFPAGSAFVHRTGLVLPTWTAARAASVPNRAVAAKALSARSLQINAKAARKGAKKLNRALRALTSHLTETGARAGDVAAVRKQAAAAVKLIANDIRLRKALARNGALKHRKLRARDVPRSSRRNRNVRKFIDKPLANILAGKDVVKAERDLIAALRAQPALP